MADPVRERIEEALLGLEVEVKQQVGSRGYELAYPGTIAEFVYDCLRQAPAVISPKLDDDTDIPDGHECCWHLSLNPEMRRMAEISASLEALDGAGNYGRASVRRVLAYLAARYGYVLADTREGRDSDG